MRVLRQRQRNTMQHMRL